MIAGYDQWKTTEPYDPTLDGEDYRAEAMADSTCPRCKCCAIEPAEGSVPAWRCGGECDETGAHLDDDRDDTEAPGCAAAYVVVSLHGSEWCWESAHRNYAEAYRFARETFGACQWRVIVWGQG